jgi:hypothetical protein
MHAAIDVQDGLTVARVAAPRRSVTLRQHNHVTQSTDDARPAIDLGKLHLRRNMERSRRQVSDIDNVATQWRSTAQTRTMRTSAGVRTASADAE